MKLHHWLTRASCWVYNLSLQFHFYLAYCKQVTSLRLAGEPFSVRGNPLDALRTCYCGVRIPRCDSYYLPLAKRFSVQKDNILVDTVSFDRMKLQICSIIAFKKWQSERWLCLKKKKKMMVGGSKMIVSHFSLFQCKNSHSLVTFLGGNLACCFVLRLFFLTPYSYMFQNQFFFMKTVSHSSA